MGNRPAPNRKRNRVKRVIGAIGAAAIVVLAFASPSAATAPPQHLVTICHATPPDTAAQGYVSITVDVASVGYQQSGHQDEHDADIIPAWSYTEGENTFSFDGKNLDNGGQAILDNDCVVPEETTTTEPPVTTTIPVTTTVQEAPAPQVYTSPAPEVTPAPIVVQDAPAELPNTGAELGALAVIGVSALGAGFAIKRRR